MKIIPRLLLCALAFCASIAAAQEPLLTNRATELRTAPDDGAVVVRTLPERTQVQLLERKSAWSKIRADKDIGWVRMMHLRGGATVVESSSGSSGMFSGFTRLLLGDSSRSSQRAQGATVGIRGFSEEDLKRAELNPAEFEKLKRYQATSADGQRLAREGKLQFRSVAYLAQDAVESAQAGGRK